MKSWEFLTETVFKLEKTEPRRVFMTKRFRANFGFYLKSVGNLQEKLDKFISFKQQNGMIKFNKKDEPFTSNVLVGIWHYHFLVGRIVAVYTVDSTHIELYDVVDHKDYDGSGTNKIRRYIDSLTSNDFVEYFPIQQKNKKQFTDEQFHDIVNIISELAHDDINALKEYIQTGEGIFINFVTEFLELNNSNEEQDFFEFWVEKTKTSFSDYIRQQIKK